MRLCSLNSCASPVRKMAAASIGRALHGFCVGLVLMLSQLAPTLGKGGGGGGSSGGSSGGGGGGWSSGQASSSGSSGKYAASGSNGGYTYSGSQKQGGSRTSSSGATNSGGSNGVDAGSRCVSYLVRSLWCGGAAFCLARCVPADRHARPSHSSTSGSPGWALGGPRTKKGSAIVKRSDGNGYVSPRSASLLASSCSPLAARL